MVSCHLKCFVFLFSDAKPITGTQRFEKIIIFFFWGAAKNYVQLTVDFSKIDSQIKS